MTTELEEQQQQQALREPVLDVSPLSPACAPHLAHAEHALFGISPFNSYFSTERIRRLASWGLSRFERVDFFIPDAPSAYTFEALGYTPEKAAWKARRQGQYPRNKVCTALRALSVAEPEARILGWAELESNQAYAALHTRGQELYENDQEFRTACRETTSWVLSGKLPQGTAPDERQIEGAVRYFLAELPLFADTPSVVGTATSVFCYHQPPAFLRRFYQRSLSWHPAAGQGFAVVTDLAQAQSANPYTNS